MVAFPLAHPSVSIYCRMRGPSRKPIPPATTRMPSSIVFFPSATTFSGMSSYFAFTINSETVFGQAGVFGNSSAGLAEPFNRSLRTANPASASDVLQNHVGSLEIPSTQFCRVVAATGRAIIARQGILIVIACQEIPGSERLTYLDGGGECASVLSKLRIPIIIRRTSVT